MFQLIVKATICLFVVWFLLVFIARVLAWKLKKHPKASQSQTEKQIPTNQFLRVASSDFFIRITVVVFLCAIFGIISSVEILHWRGRANIQAFINSHRNAITVTIRGQEIKDPKYVDMLATVHAKSAHHSHDDNVIAVNLHADSGEQLSMTLAKDSQDPHEYHVYMSPYSRNQYDWIGVVDTELFDK
jgi:hypothetical protein